MKFGLLLSKWPSKVHYCFITTQQVWHKKIKTKISTSFHCQYFSLVSSCFWKWRKKWWKQSEGRSQSRSNRRRSRAWERPPTTSAGPKSCHPTRWWSQTKRLGKTSAQGHQATFENYICNDWYCVVNKNVCNLSFIIVNFRKREGRTKV